MFEERDTQREIREEPDALHYITEAQEIGRQLAVQEITNEELLLSATSLVYEAMELAFPDQQEAAVEKELVDMVAWCSGTTRNEKMMQILEPQAQHFPIQLWTATHARVWAMTSNTVDKRNSRLKPSASEANKSAAATRLKRRNIAVDYVMGNVLRLRDQHCVPPIVLMESIESVFLHERSSSRRRKSLRRDQLPTFTVRKFLNSVEGWAPACPFVPSAKIAMHVRDNWDRLVSVKYQRREEGQQVESEMLHCTTGEDIPVPETLTPHDTPNELSYWPFIGKLDLKAVVSPLNLIQHRLTEVWKNARTYDLWNIEDLMERPDADADQQKGRPPTHHTHAKVIMDCSTASYNDNKKIVTSVREAYPNVEKHVIGCDQQTFSRLWWLKFSEPNAWNDIVPLAGDLHGLMHFVDGVFQYNWELILEPIFLYCGGKGVGKKFVAKEHSRRLYWLFMLLAAGIVWIESWAPVELRNDPVNLLKYVDNNKPAKAMIGFLFYFAMPAWKYRQAVQTSDVVWLDFIWEYALYMYAGTNKRNYKTLCLQMLKIVRDSEPNVRSTLDHMRTCSLTGRNSAGVGWDYLNEKVAHCTHIACFVFTFVLSDQL
jgi:hypothetical protein